MSIETYNATIEYRKLGLINHPLSSSKDTKNSPGKRPLITGWQNIGTPTDEELKEWFLNTDNNIGLQCGARSNVTVLDFDHELFRNEIFNGIELNTRISGRTNGRGHVYFKFNSILQSQKHHDLGIEVLSNGSNAVMPPSVHVSGDVYKWVDPNAPIMEMPEEVIKRLNKLFRTETELKQIIAKCRHCFRDILKRKPDMHGAEGREYMIAVCTDIKAVKDEYGEPIASEEHIKMFAKLMYDKDYNEKRTLEEWRNLSVDKTWRCDTLKAKLPQYIDSNLCEKCDKRKEKRTKSKNPAINKDEQLDDSYHRTDLGNAERLRDLFGENIRFCHPYNKWMVWTGKKWDVDKAAHLESLARSVIKSIYEEGFNTPDYEEKQKIISFALKSESNRGIEAMISVAKSEPGIPINPSEFDRNKMLFNVQNGTIDLKTGELKTHNKTDLLTKISPVTYDVNAKCPVWLAFINRIFAGKQDIIEYMQRKSGYILTGETGEEEFDELYGTGGNGKSKFTGAIIYIMGEYHQKTNVETIHAVKNAAPGGASSPDVACLKGARLVTVSEPEKGTQLNEQRVKDWTGRDPITARHLYQEPFTFEPEFKLWIYTNYRLRIKGQDNGIWRRVKLVPFEVEIPKEEQDTELLEKLKAEAPGILNWMIEGCLKWQKDGLKVPDEIIQATKDYKVDQDYLGDFFKECCEFGNTYKAPFKWLHLTYRAYCDLMDMPAQSHITFSETLIDRKMKVSHTNKGNIYTGIRLKVNIEEKCNEINKISVDLKSEGVKVMREFLVTFLESFSYGDLLKIDSSPSQPSLQPSKNQDILPTKNCGICGSQLTNNYENVSMLGFVHPSCKFEKKPIKVLMDVPAFVCIDNVTRSLKAGEIANIPAINALALISRKVAIKEGW